jgi:hypothetical protein
VPWKNYTLYNQIDSDILNHSWAWWLIPVIPATQEAEIRIVIPGQSGQKVPETPSQPIKKPCIVAFTCHPSYMGSITSRNVVRASPGKNSRTYVRNN